MLDKIAIAGIRFAAKKARNTFFDKMAQKSFEPYERFKREVYGVNPLNVGEREFIDCMRRLNNQQQCEKVMRNAIEQYYKTGKY